MKSQFPYVYFCQGARGGGVVIKKNNLQKEKSSSEHERIYKKKKKGAGKGNLLFIGDKYNENEESQELKNRIKFFFKSISQTKKL